MQLPPSLPTETSQHRDGFHPPWRKVITKANKWRHLSEQTSAPLQLSQQALPLMRNSVTWFFQAYLYELLNLKNELNFAYQGLSMAPGALLGVGLFYSWRQMKCLE